MLKFLQLVLDHGTLYNQPPTFDILSNFYFADNPNMSFSAIIFQKLPLLGDPNRPMQLLVEFADLVVAIWNRCFDEQLWEPIKYLVALVSFTFSLHASEVAPFVLPRLAPISQATICTLAEWRHRLQDPDNAEEEEYRLLDEHINTHEVLSLLYITALTYSTALEETDAGTIESKATHFWKHISLELVFLLLTPKQKLPDILGMLELLATSSLPSSIGPITDEKEPPFVARHVIERVAGKLSDFPRSATSPAQKRAVRLAALRTLIAFARHPFGAMQLATHGTALPRLVNCLSTSIDELYDQSIPLSILPSVGISPGREPDASTVLCQIISHCVKLIHFLVTNPKTANEADISQKLSTSYGGSQRYLLALGRLTFAEEDLVMESGIDGDTVEAAHELLEMAVTPDEGEIMSEAFGS